MIAHIARKDFTEMIRDGRFRLAAGIVFALLLVSFALGWKHHRDTSAQHEQARQATRRQWLNQGEKNPHSAAHYGVYAFKPKMPLSLVDQGVDNFTGVAVWLEAHNQNEFRYRPAQDATAVERFGELTAATVLQILLPLLIILLSFAAFAGEREAGTLRQVLSLGVRKRDLAFGKALGVAGALALLLVPATVIGVAALSFTDGGGATSDHTFRMMLMGCGYLLYFGTIVAIALAVSAQAPSSRFALIALLGLWITSSLIIPRAATDISRRIHPTPSAIDFATRIEYELKNDVNGHSPSDHRLRELEARTLRQYNVERLEALPVNFAGISLQEGEEHGYKIFDKHYSGLWNTFASQNRVQQLAGVVAPLLAVRSLSMGLAGTDFTQHRDFAQSAEGYRRTLIKTVNEDITYNSKTGDTGYTAGRSLYEQVPAFQYTAPGVAWVLSNQLLSVVVLLAWFAAAALLMIFATTRMRVD